MGIGKLYRFFTELEIGRFLIAGGSAALLNWLLRFPLNCFLPYGLAVLASTILGMTYGFFVYRSFVFRTAKDIPLRRGMAFLLVNLFSLALTVVSAVAFKALLIGNGLGTATAAALAHAVGIGLGAISNYVGHRNITFSTKERDLLR